jgi:hypothetical protein
MSKKPIISLSMLTYALSVLLLTGCAVQRPPDIIEHYDPYEAEHDQIQSSEPFNSAGVVQLENVKDLGFYVKDHGLYRRGHTAKIERGQINGVSYTIYYADGSASFIDARKGERVDGNAENFRDRMDSTWHVSCRKDPINDSKSCSINRRDLWVYVYPSKPSIISVGSNHFPGSTVTVRIDGSEPLSASANNDGNYNSGTSSRIIERLKQGEEITTRYMEWPYQSWMDRTWNLQGFSEAYAYSRWAVQHMR